MTVFIHNYWQYFFVVACVVLLGLEIPRKAIFFKPQQEHEVVPFASLVTYDDKTYADLMRRVQVSWKVRQGGISGGVTDIGSDIDSLVLEQEQKSFEYLELNQFLHANSGTLPKNRILIPHRALKPRTLAAPAAGAWANAAELNKGAGNEDSPMRKSMLEIPDSLNY